MPFSVLYACSKSVLIIFIILSELFFITGVQINCIYLDVVSFSFQVCLHKHPIILSTESK